MNMIEVSYLNKKYGDFTAMKDISFHAREGGLFGFLGISGARRSAMIHALTTLFSPNGGTVQICNHRLGRDSQKICRCTGAAPQQNRLDDKLDVRENLLIHGSLYENSRNALRHREKEVRELLGLQEIVAKRYARLSEELKQHYEVTAVLMHESRILSLDEPTARLDLATRQSVQSCIEQLRKKHKTIVFLITHYMEEAAKAAHIVMIGHGELLEYGTPYELRDHRAKNRLILTTVKRERLAKLLQHLQASYEQNGQRYQIELDTTMDALQILPAVQPYIEGFEVLQGTMDDIFLHITGKTPEEKVAL